MLLNLHIENVAIINKIDIDFSGGFNVLTGETGAGKSIIIDSINLLLGNKGSKELISTNKDYAFVSAIFCDFNDAQKEFFASNDIEVDQDGNIVVSRKINKDGRSISKINGQTVTVSILKKISPMLVQIFGQHDGLKILETSSHIGYLDDYCKNDALINEYKAYYDQVKKARINIQKLTELKENRETLEQTLRFQIEQIEKADIKVGEYEKLKMSLASVQNSALISEVLYNSQGLLNDDSNGVVSAVSNLCAELEKIKDSVQDAKTQLDNAKSAQAILLEIASFVGDKLSGLEEGNMSPDYIENRLYTIEKVLSKYQTEQNALDELEKLKAQLDQIENTDQQIEEAVLQYESIRKQLDSAAKKISDSRKNGAKKLCDEMSLQLSALDMPKVKFCIDVVKNQNSRGGTKYNPFGYDSVEFLISANEGQTPKPLSKIASGGELSRIMLCLKTALSGNKDECYTYIYDEVDSGVSGATAQKIGFKLKDSGTDKQVFCITHLAQIASLANCHYKVEKHTDSLGTYSNIVLLDKQSRIKEIARIIGGVSITEQIYKTAQEMIENC